MKDLLITRKLWIAALITLLFASNALASGGGTLVVESKSKGRHYSITVKPDGTFESPALDPGTYSFRFKPGSTVPHQIKLSYSVSSPRDPATGQASGKRSKTTEAKVVLGGIKTSEGFMSGGSISIDEPGVHLTGSLSAVDASEKTMALDDWMQTK